MTDEGVSFVTGLDASDPAVAQRLSAEYDAVVLCCGAEEPRPIGLETKGVKGVCYGDYPSVQRNVYSLKAIGISGAVISLMTVMGCFSKVREISDV